MKAKTIVLTLTLALAVLGFAISAALLVTPVEGMHIMFPLAMSLLSVCLMVLAYFAFVDHVERDESVTNFYLAIMQDTDTAADDFGVMQALQRDDEKAAYVRGGRAVKSG